MERKRSANFSIEDKRILIELISNNYQAILNKKTDGNTIKVKQAAWDFVTQSFNRLCLIQRSKESLKKMFTKLKSEAKIYKVKQMNAVGSPDGEHHIILNANPIYEAVLSLLAQAGVGLLQGPRNCDISNDSMQINPALPLYTTPLPSPTQTVTMTEQSTINTLSFSTSQPSFTFHKYTMSPESSLPYVRSYTTIPETLPPQIRYMKTMRPEKFSGNSLEEEKIQTELKKQQVLDAELRNKELEYIKLEKEIEIRNLIKNQWECNF